MKLRHFQLLSFTIGGNDSFYDGFADLAFEAGTGHGDTGLARDLLLRLGYAEGSLPRECNSGDFHKSVMLKG